MGKPLRTWAYWARHKKHKCQCGGYWFPHRRMGGACYHNPNEVMSLYYRAKHHGMPPDELQKLLEAPKQTEATQRYPKRLTARSRAPIDLD
jgi:hypothetical protein